MPCLACAREECAAAGFGGIDAEQDRHTCTEWNTADEIAHDAVEPPLDGPDSMLYAAAFERLATATRAAFRALRAGGTVDDARMAVAEVLS